VAEFLSVLKLGTRNVYSRALEVFQQFYSSQGSIRDFLDSVEQDRLLPRSERRRVDRLTLSSFVVCLRNKGYSPKTIRIYVGAVQSLAKYFDAPHKFALCAIAASPAVKQEASLDYGGSARCAY